MSDKKKPGTCKPPVPARPKNLVVLNSKHLPKPPETFSSENVTSIIKDLNLDLKGENERGRKKIKQMLERFENSDSEEDTYGYLEPVTLLPSTPAGVGMIGKVNVQYQHKNIGCVSKVFAGHSGWVPGVDMKFTAELLLIHCRKKLSNLETCLGRSLTGMVPLAQE